MTVTPEPLSIESTHCRVRARLSNIYADGPDEGTGPDWRAPTGEAVTLTPGIAGELLAYDVQGEEPRVIMVEKVECMVGAGGWLKTKSDGQDVYIVPTDDPLLSVTGWTWTATIRGKSIKFAAPMGGVVDLAMFVAAPATDDTKTWVERIPDLVALVEAGSDPAVIAAAVEDYLVANPLAAADIDSGEATDGHVLTADGAGGAAWEAPPAGGGGSIAGLNVVTGSWPPPLNWGEYPPGTLYVRDPEEYDGPVMAVRAVEGWEPLAVDSPLSEGYIDNSVFTAGAGKVIYAGWSFGWSFGTYGGESSLKMSILEAPEPGDILCTFDPSSLTFVEGEILRSASAWDMGVLTGKTTTWDEPITPLGVHHLIIDPWDGFIKYLWTVGGAPPAADDRLHLSWPVTIHSDYWEQPEGGGVAT